MERDYNSELKAAIDILKSMKFKFKTKEPPPESLTKATLLAMAKQILKEFNQNRVPGGEFNRITMFCNRIAGYWGGEKNIPKGFNVYVIRLKASAFAPIQIMELMKNEEIKKNCLNLVNAFIRTYVAAKVKTS